MAKDAWLQEHELHTRFFREWGVRRDLRVSVLATDRAVTLSLGELQIKGPLPTVTTRNVRTMRELAACIVAACDFVDSSNPVWASHAAPWLPETIDPDTFLEASE